MGRAEAAARCENTTYPLMIPPWSRTTSGGCAGDIGSDHHSSNNLPQRDRGGDKGAIERRRIGKESPPSDPLLHHHLHRCRFRLNPPPLQIHHQDLIPISIVSTSIAVPPTPTVQAPRAPSQPSNGHVPYVRLKTGPKRTSVQCAAHLVVTTESPSTQQCSFTLNENCSLDGLRIERRVSVIVVLSPQSRKLTFIKIDSN